MVETASVMLPLGTKAPSFELKDAISEKNVSLEEIASPVATVIMFICNHCPYVKHIQKKLVTIAKEYQAKGIVFVAINSNDVAAYPDDSPENMRRIALKEGYTFPYLYDATQEIAKAYKAACTPDFYIFDKDLGCVYRGRFDDSNPSNNKPVTGNELSSALSALLDNKKVNATQYPSLGCNIKWK